jgi:hypothetical protein
VKKWKHSAGLLRLLRPCTCPGFFLRKKIIIIVQAAHQALGTCFHLELLRFNPPLCNYSRSPSTGDLQFSSTSQLGASTRKWGSRFRLREVDPSFEEFLASLATMLVWLLSIKPDMGCMKIPSLLFLKSYATLIF